MNLFSTEIQHFKLPNAELIYHPNFFSESISNTYYNNIQKNTPWQHDDITIFGKTYKQPRLTALYGTTNMPYGYSNIIMYPKALTTTLQEIKVVVENATNHQFNTLLINLYRDGNDSNGWHADNEKELGKNPVIASVSFGENRPFYFKHRTLKNQKHKLLLNHGSLLIMKGEMQHYWLHQIAKTKKVIQPRINLTFRQIITK